MTIKRLILFLFLPILGATSPNPKKAPLKSEHLYFSKFFGHLYQFPSVGSPSLKTLSCGQRVAVYSIENKHKKGLKWKQVKTEGVEGHIQSIHLQKKRPLCFQSRYPKFFNALNLSVTEMYYFGRLNDLYLNSVPKRKR
ncbi:MAG: hypothetical protein OXB88_09600 [Bacteriovoracales bacterium]|nr:hypothetical protein [Bacteriovoracales bacterium]